MPCTQEGNQDSILTSKLAADIYGLDKKRRDKAFTAVLRNHRARC